MKSNGHGRTWQRPITMLSDIVSGIMGCVLLALLSGCTHTIYDKVETIRATQDEITRWRTDTVIDRDTINILQRGDTIFSEAVKWRWRIKEIHDTIRTIRIDSVSVPYPVERQLTLWERTKQDWGGTAIGVTIFFISSAVLWLITKFRK